jgi:hypothetical protein
MEAYKYPVSQTCYGISEIQTADSYGSSEFMKVRILVVCAWNLSFQYIHNSLSAIKYLLFCYAIPAYVYRKLLKYYIDRFRLFTNKGSSQSVV